MLRKIPKKAKKTSNNEYRNAQQRPGIRKLTDNEKKRLIYRIDDETRETKLTHNFT